MADAAQAREQAHEILSQRRFQESEVPRPFEEPLAWLGRRVEDVGRWFDDLFSGIDDLTPGGGWVVWLLVAILVAAIAVVLARNAVRRRAVAAYGRSSAAPGALPVDPGELERAAEAAEREGDFERAVRLRFRAGVVRLERGRVLDPAGPWTTGEIGAVLRSDAFDSLGTDFDAIAYGGRPAAADDARAAREGWTAVLERAR